MPDLKKYWREIRDIERTLPEFCWVVSLEDPKRGQKGGSIAQVRGSTAAKLLHAKSHRLANEMEIEDHYEQEAAAKKRLFYERLRSLGIAVTTIPE